MLSVIKNMSKKEKEEFLSDLLSSKCDDMNPAARLTMIDELKREIYGKRLPGESFLSYLFNEVFGFHRDPVCYMAMFLVLACIGSVVIGVCINVSR